MARRQTLGSWVGVGLELARRDRYGRGEKRSRLLALTGALAVAYTALLYGWAAVRLLIGDGAWWAFLLNTFAFYLFAPLAIIVPLAVALRSRPLRFAAIAGTALFLATYGALFVPRALRPAPPAGAPRLTAMTFNVLKTNVDPAGVAAALRRSGADLIGLQEVSPAVERALRRDLANLYPHQLYGDPTEGGRTALLSRYPLEPTGIRLPGRWVDLPLVARLRVAGATVTAIDAHPVSSGLVIPEIEEEVRQRAQTAHAIADFVRAQAGPVVLLCDFNAGDQSAPYATVTRALGDAWREGGFGPGGTFPGAASPGSSRPRVLGLLVPQWLIRIDYVFHSRHWRTVDARIGPWDGVSDHRPVVATLALVALTDR